LSKKSEARAARQAERDARFEATKARILATLAPDQGPRVADLPPDEKFRLAVGANARELVVPMQPRVAAGAGRLDLRVTWCTRKRDVDGAWSWEELRQWSQEEWDSIIEPAFNQFGQLTWGEIDSHSSDTGHKLHHSQELGRLSQEAQDRWSALGFEEFDPLFRFRMGNKRRFWGFILQGHFFGVWWERNHKIAPTAGE
jgi:hypothetical protein